MNNNLSIKQGHSIYIYDDELDFIERVLKAKGIDLNSLDRTQNILTLSQRYVGYIKTNRRIIELVPKHDDLTLKHVMRIYYFVYGNFRNFEDEIFDLSSSVSYENIISMFLNELKDIKRKGLPTDYVSRQELSKYIRGSVNFVESYKNIRRMHEHPFVCEVDELSLNTELNRILKAALKKVSNIKKYSSDARLLKNMFKAVDDIAYKGESKSITFDSKNFYCKNAYFLAKLILDESYLDSTGVTGGECFLIDFDALFEEFIKKILFHVSNDIRFTQWNKDKEYGMYASITKRYMPDILYGYSESDNSAIAILDVKNKFSSTFRNADVFQMLFYSGMLSSRKLILCYPATEDKPIDELEIYSDNFLANKIYATYINIGGDTKQDFSDAIYKFIYDVYTCIDKM